MDILASLNMLNVLSAFPFANTKWTRIDTGVGSTEIELFIYTCRKLCHLHCSAPLWLPEALIVPDNPVSANRTIFFFFFFFSFLSSFSSVQ